MGSSAKSLFQHLPPEHPPPSTLHPPPRPPRRSRGYMLLGTLNCACMYIVYIVDSSSGTVDSHRDLPACQPVAFPLSYKSKFTIQLIGKSEVGTSFLSTFHYDQSKTKLPLVGSYVNRKKKKPHLRKRPRCSPAFLQDSKTTVQESILEYVL